MKQQNVKVKLGSRSYDITVSPGILERCSNMLKPYVNNKKCFIISDSNVFPLYGKQVINELRKAKGIIAGQFNFPAGEKSKTLSTTEKIYHSAIDAKLDRSSVIIALGGGVVGDIAGFVGATYMRGIDFIQIPTSLLAMVDSSVGGKTGVDMPEGKNLIGTFWQPKFVLIDPETLKTLPEREIRSGLAEIIKYGIILDRSFFDELDSSASKINNLDMGFYSKVITRSCTLKSEIVQKDERESGVRAILNYGHTFGQAIEAVTEYKTYTHGEAVAVGMLMAGELACSVNMMSHDELKKMSSLFKSLELCTSIKNLDADEIFAAMQKDKKTTGGKLNLILPEKIGKVSIITNINKTPIINTIKKYIKK